MVLQPILKLGVSFKAIGARHWQPEFFLSLAPPVHTLKERCPWMAGGLAGAGIALSSLLPEAGSPAETLLVTQVAGLWDWCPGQGDCGLARLRSQTLSSPTLWS